MKEVVSYIIFLQACFNVCVKVDEQNLFITFHKPLKARFLEPVVSAYYLARGMSFDSLELSKDVKVLPWLCYRVYCDKQFRHYAKVYVLDLFEKNSRYIQSINIKL